MTDSSTTTTSTTANSAAEVAAATAQRIAEQGLHAIRELERVLLFTDLKDDAEAIASSTAVANQALKDLQRATTPLPGSTTGTSTYVTIHNHEEKEESKMEQQPETAVTQVTWSNKWNEWMNRVKVHVEATLESGNQTWKETERKLLFTDYEDLVAKYDAKHGITRPTSVARSSARSSTSTLAKTDYSVNMTLLLLKIQEQLQHMLKQLETKVQSVQQSTTQAMKQAERTLFFTDIPDKSSLVANQQRSKQDVVRHFVNSQQVLEELQRTVFFTDCK